jgi:hypothetical protein
MKTQEPCAYRGCVKEFLLTREQVERAFEVARAHDIDAPLSMGGERGAAPFRWDARSSAINLWVDFRDPEDPMVSFYFEDVPGVMSPKAMEHFIIEGRILVEPHGPVIGVHVTADRHPTGGMPGVPLPAAGVEEALRAFRGELLGAAP